VPDWRFAKRYAPVVSATVSRDAPVSLCVTVTVAPGTAAPDSSVTLPTSDPYRTWARSDTAEPPRVKRRTRAVTHKDWERARWSTANSPGRELLIIGSPLTAIAYCRRDGRHPSSRGSGTDRGGRL